MVNVSADQDFNVSMFIFVRRSCNGMPLEKDSIHYMRPLLCQNVSGEQLFLKILSHRTWLDIRCIQIKKILSLVV